ncbi:MAG: Histidine--tRNA ligase [Phycisphaerales bacterium]|nr:Histidine--tRNA ligase [Phycisphaerales bacterium]
MCPAIQPPNGTRDLYPIEAARRRFITEAWRRVSINHGFEEIDGPTFEHLELYTVKSGEGIVSELFSFRREGGEKDFALRPEFTPTLARMYAARAGSLPKPTKWFTCGPFFRAERPQRGRLREFLQWNCDVIGGASTHDLVQADAEAIACCVELLRELGLTPADVRVKIGHREIITAILWSAGLSRARTQEALQLLDRRPKIEKGEFHKQSILLGLDPDRFDELTAQVQSVCGRELEARVNPETHIHLPNGESDVTVPIEILDDFKRHLDAAGVSNWCQFDLSIARGLAYYTGMVFEVIVDGERAVAGGGRYDNLIELFGGPSTPAVGFGMGDVVLSLVLQDKGLMPTDAELLEIAGQRPDVFVISNGTPEADAKLGSVVAELRRSTGRQSHGLHVRRSYKATRNVGKLLREASDIRARFAVILESGTEATIKNLETGEQDQARTPVASLGEQIRRRRGN